MPPATAAVCGLWSAWKTGSSSPRADLDPTFGVGGKVALNIGANGPQYANDVAIQTDGKIVIAGRASVRFSSEADFIVARYNTDGSLDRSFGYGGFVTIDFSGGSDSAGALVIDSEGRIVVAGSGSSQFAVARLDTNGQLDSTFDGDGKQTIDFGAGAESASAVAIDDAGRIVLAGSATGDFAVARLDTNGQLDSTFDGDGKQTIDFSGGSDSASGVAIDSEGRIVVAGSAAGEFAVARLDVNGQLDSNFDGDGKQTVDISGGRGGASGIAIDSEGRIVLVGTSQFFNFAVARLRPNGQLDSTFDGDGKKTFDFGTRVPYCYGNDVAIDAADRIVVVGRSHEWASDQFQVAVARLGPGGAFDSTFDGDGKKIVGFGGPIGAGSAVAIDDAGRIVVAGISYNEYPDPYYIEPYDIGIMRLDDLGQTRFDL